MQVSYIKYSRLRKIGRGVTIIETENKPCPCDNLFCPCQEYRDWVNGDDESERES